MSGCSSLSRTIDHFLSRGRFLAADDANGSAATASTSPPDGSLRLRGGDCFRRVTATAAAPPAPRCPWRRALPWPLGAPPAPRPGLHPGRARRAQPGARAAARAPMLVGRCRSGDTLVLPLLHVIEPGPNHGGRVGGTMSSPAPLGSSSAPRGGGEAGCASGFRVRLVASTLSPVRVAERLRPWLDASGRSSCLWRARRVAAPPTSGRAAAPRDLVGVMADGAL